MSITRRTLLRGIPSLGAVMAVPAIASPTLTPDERIKAATAEIAAAMAEKYPGWRHPQVKNQNVPILNAQGQRIRTSRHAVLIFASEEKFGPEEGMWWVRDVQ